MEDKKYITKWEAFKALEDGKMIKRRGADSPYRMNGDRLEFLMAPSTWCPSHESFENIFKGEFEIVELKPLKMPELGSGWRNKADHRIMSIVTDFRTAGAGDATKIIVIDKLNHTLSMFHKEWEPIPDSPFFTIIEGAPGQIIEIQK